MGEARVGERERVAGEWFGAPLEGQVPVRASGGGTAAARDGAEPSTPSRWLRRIGRVLRDAAIVVAICAMVPIGLTTFVGPRILGVGVNVMENTRAKLANGELARHLAPAKDPSITPMQAGEALAALQPAPTGTQYFVLRPVARRTERPWNDAKLSSDMFDGGRNSSWVGPNYQKVFDDLARGLTPAELGYLKMVATAPAWNEFDRVARAPAVDVIGGRFQLPFSDGAQAFNLPIMKFGATKEMAYAGVSRAAYYLATGRRAEAEAALRNIIGFGFAIVDNGTSALDGLIGRVIVGIGRDGLERYFRATNDPRLADVVAAQGVQQKDAPPSAWKYTGVKPAHDASLQLVADATVPRTIRLAVLQRLALSSCSNPAELIFGTSSDIKDAYKRAGTELARFPSERALLDMALSTTERPLEGQVKLDVIGRVVVGSATIASVVLRNPRMAFCTRVFAGGGYPF